MWILACVSAPITTAPADDIPPAAEDAAPDHLPAPEAEAEFFDPTVIHAVDLTMDAAAWADVRDNPWAETWWPAALVIDGEAVGEVGVRAFGAGSLIAGKPSLKISLDHVVAGTRWHGLEQFKLDNSSQDVGYLNEHVATEAMRLMGVPAARTGWARVSANGADVGFFVALESIDDRFLSDWFGNDDGPLYGMISGRWGQGLLPMDTPLDWYEIQTSVPGDGQELADAAARLAAGEDVGDVVDLDGFFRESIVRSVLGGLDTFSADGNNFYLYVDGGVIRIIPWDFDYDLGTGGVAACLGIPPTSPWDTSPWSYNAVTGADYADPVLRWNLDHGADVDTIVAEARADAIDWGRIDAAVVERAALIEPEVASDVLGYGPRFGPRVADMRLFLHQRLTALAGEDVAPCPELDGTPVSALGPTGTVGWGSLRVDATDWGPGFSVNGEHYCRGLFAHAPSEVVIEVPAGATSLRGAVGLQDWNQVCGDGATFSIEQAGVTLWTSGSRATYDPAEVFVVAVAPGPLTLRAAPNAEYSCDTAAWLDVAAI